MGQIKAGKFKPLALTTATRSSELPQVPTLAEAGVSGFEMSTWYGMFVTSGTPPEVTQRLQTELAKILKMPDIQTKLKGLGGEPGNISPEQFAQLNRQEFTRFGDLIKKANIKLE
jgi:tripartite-type tricarboxylate transporter receptor subunit TctC